MTQVSHHDAASWAILDCSYPRGPSPVSLICLVTSAHVNEPWVVVCRSALLRKLKLPGLGLYAARPMGQGSCVGRYEGTTVGRFKSFDEAMVSAVAHQLLLQGHTKLATRQVPKHGVDLIDGETGGGAMLQLINDPRGTGYRANVELRPSGKVVVTSKNIPAFNFNKSVRWNVRSELRFRYGEGYWKALKAIGKSIECAIDVSE